MLRVCVMWAMIALLSVSVAFAGEADMADATPEAFGYTLNDVAVNNGVVAYWYAIGYANCTGCYPETFAEMVEYGMPIRGFVSPFNGDVIDPDDGALDFDGDFTYAVDGCYGPMIMVQTTDGVVELPGYVVGHSDISVQFDPCCVGCLYTGCVDITECGFDYWGPCIDPTECICRVVEGMTWKSFELFEKLYGHRPASEYAWYASGLAPFDANFKEYVPSMNVEFIYKGDCNCCYLKKAYVTCCEPCVPCDPCETKCKPDCKKECCEPKCKPDCKKSCCEFKWCSPKPCPDPCATDCDSCTKSCAPKCDPCKPKCETKCEKKCDPCKPKCKPDCKKECCEPKCDPCKPKCETKCEKKCDPCKPCCEFNWCSDKPCPDPCDNDCDSCTKKCNTCKPKCGGC